MFLNRQHAKKREQLGKTAVVVDESMMRKKHMEDSKAVELEGHAQGHERRAVEEDNGLLDMTDIRNEDFIYVY